MAERVLTKFEGHDVTAATVSIRKAGDGLSARLSLAPVELHHGDEVFFVLKGVVVDVQTPPVDRKKPEGDLTRAHVVDTTSIAIVAEADVKGLLDAEAETVRLLQDEAKGVVGLPGFGPYEAKETEDGGHVHIGTSSLHDDPPVLVSHLSAGHDHETTEDAHDENVAVHEEFHAGDD